MKRTLKWLGVTVLVILAAWGAFYGYQRFYANPGQDRSLLENILTANTIVVRRGDIVKTIAAFGEVSLKEEAILYFKTDGTLKEITVKEGERVEEGQVLAKLSNAQQELRLLQARNAYEAAKITAPPNEVKEKELEYQIAQESYEDTILKAPFAGEVTAIHAREGDYVSNKTDIISLINRDEMFITVDIDEVDIREISLGQKALVTFDAYPDLELPAEVTHIGYRAVPKGGIKVIEVALKLLENDPRIKPGFSAKAEIVVAEAKDVLRVPLLAITTIEGRSFVTLVKETGTEPVRVEVGLTTEEFAQIVSGLKEGDRIITVSYPARDEQSQQKGRGGPFSPFDLPRR
jgi:multidrug efflux pump subunit AcrA (membrane-fusion protein)